VRRRTNAALTLAAMMSTVAALAVVAAGPASATYRPPSIRQVCGGTEESSVCVLPPGVTTAPNSYSAAIAVTKTGLAGATVTFAVTAGSLPPGEPPGGRSRFSRYGGRVRYGPPGVVPGGL
jgi:hypothetical protein